MIEKEELFSVVPHRGRMLLLSRVKGCNLDERIIEAEYDITEECLFYDPEAAGVPSWIGFELIAQTISAFSGIRDRETEKAPRIGFILSVSSMRTGISFFKTGSTAVIKAMEIGRMDSVYTFKGEIFLEGNKVLEGKLTVLDVDNEQAQILKRGADLD